MTGLLLASASCVNIRYLAYEYMYIFTNNYMYLQIDIIWPTYIYIFTNDYIYL